MSASEPIVNIATKADFDSLIASNPHVALQATASWCGPCRAISPIYHKQALASAPKNIVFARFDIDHDSALSQELRINSVPTFLFFENGTVLNRVVGASPPSLLHGIADLVARAGDKP